MGGFENKWWNLCQAAVWCEFRETALVDAFAVPDRDAYKALHRYPTHWPDNRKPISDGTDLDRRLRDGSLKSWGVRASGSESPELITSNDWQDLRLDPPVVYSVHARHTEPWRSVRVLREDALRLWPRSNQGKNTPIYDPSKIKAIFDEIVGEGQDLSDRQMAHEISIRHRERFGIDGPSRTWLLRRFKSWKRSDTP